MKRIPKIRFFRLMYIRYKTLLLFYIKILHTCLAIVLHTDYHLEKPARALESTANPITHCIMTLICSNCNAPVGYVTGGKVEESDFFLRVARSSRTEAPNGL